MIMVFKELFFENNLKYEDLGNMAFRNMSWGTKMDAIVGKFDLEILSHAAAQYLTRGWLGPRFDLVLTPI